MKMKRIISVLVAFTMLFSASAIATRADTAVEIPLLENIKGAISYATDGVNDARITLVPTDRPDTNEFCMFFTTDDGEERRVTLGAYYNTATGEVHGYNYEQGVFDSGFGYNVNDKVFYTTKDAWQRQFGFTPLYDILSIFFGYDYATRRIFFDYDGKEWMIQIWKGNYFYSRFTGGEVGIYNRPEGTKNGLFFNCASDEEMMPVSMKVYDSNKVYLERQPQTTWWLTGFVFADGRVPLTQIHMDTSIQFPNEEMCLAFAQSAEKVRGITCTTQGTTAYLVW